MSASFVRLLPVLLVLGGCPEPTGPEREISGEQLFNQYCARCHGVDGKGVADAQVTSAKLADPNVAGALSDQAMYGIIRAGKGQMPAFRDTFTEASLMVLVAYVRSLSDPRPAPEMGHESNPR
jgi:mono/diheme cytochrome c family protein